MKAKLLAGGNDYNAEVIKPNLCDMCGRPHKVGDNIFNARTRHGQWANMCENCHLAFGICLGPGYGQKYEVIDND